MANTYDLHNPKHFYFDMDNACENYDDGFPDDAFVEIFPLESLSDRSFDQYEEKDYCSPTGGVDFTWAPKSMVDRNGGVNEGYECGFEFTGTPDDLEKELRALGLVSVYDDM